MCLEVACSADPVWARSKYCFSLPDSLPWLCFCKREVCWGFSKLSACAYRHWLYKLYKPWFWGGRGWGGCGSETHCVALASLDLSKQIRLASNSQISSRSLLPPPVSAVLRLKACTPIFQHWAVSCLCLIFMPVSLRIPILTHQHWVSLLESKAK